MRLGNNKYDIAERLDSCESFKIDETTFETNKVSIHPMLGYDFLGKPAGNINLACKSIAGIPLVYPPFALYGDYKIQAALYLAQ